MFAPEGFVPLSKFLAAPPKEIATAAARLFPNAEDWRKRFSLGGPVQGEPNDIEWQRGFEAYRFFRGSHDDTAEHFLLEALCDWLHIASPGDHTPQRIDLGPTLSPYGEQECCIYDLYFEGPNFPIEFVNRYRLFEKNLPDLLSHWIALPDGKSFPSIAEYMSEHCGYGLGCGHFQLPWWFERQCGTVDLTVFDLVSETNPAHTDLSPFEQTAKVLREFQGQSICIPSKFFEVGWPNTSSFLPFFTRDRKQIGGRPNKVDGALQAFDRHYPNGRTGTWKDVVRALKEKDGIEISDDTLSRAYNNREKNDKEPEKPTD